MTSAILPPQNMARFRVIKVGGSLFSMSDLRERIEAWSVKHADPNCVNLWVAGGGKMVDAVRDWQNSHGLDDVEAHRISINLLSTTARLFHSLFSDWQLAININQIHTTEFFKGSNVVFDCSKWAKANRSLKADWETTSDSIALRLAIELNAMELHLLKSASPSSPKIEDAITNHLVDKHFAVQLKRSADLSVKISDLRNQFEPVEMEIY